jgi:sigma-E factor negative regulatory protein RseC
LESSIAKVVSVHGNSAVLKVEDGVACARCAAGKGCGAGLLGQSRQSRQLEVSIPPGMTLRTGDQVRLSLQPARVLHAALLAYGLPLAGICIALAAALLFEQSLSDAKAVAYALSGGTAGLLAGRQFLKRDACLQHLLPQVSQRLSPDEFESAQHGA